MDLSMLFGGLTQSDLALFLVTLIRVGSLLAILFAFGYIFSRVSPLPLRFVKRFALIIALSYSILLLISEVNNARRISVQALVEIDRIEK
jgi:hypothetical protein